MAVGRAKASAPRSLRSAAIPSTSPVAAVRRNAPRGLIQLATGRWAAPARLGRVEEWSDI